jgi:hypothetical protein
MADKRSVRSLLTPLRDADSVTRQSTVTGQLTELFPLWLDSTERARELDRWYYNELDKTDMPKLPRKVTADIKDLREGSVTGWAKMIADSMTQDLILDGLRQEDGETISGGWDIWQRNGLDSRQRSVHDGIIHHGKAFNLIRQAKWGFSGEVTAQIRGKSARHCDAYFRDDLDEYPEIFLEGRVRRDDAGHEEIFWTFVDNTAYHYLVTDRDGAKPRYISNDPHGMVVCPAVRGTINLSLDGRAIGEIEPYIHLFKRLNQSTMDRLVVQRFGAFVIRYIAGIDKPETDEAQRAAAMALSLTDLLMVENPQAKIGGIPATALDGYIRSRESDIRDLSAVSQTPSFHMLGLSDNVGAEGLAAAEASHMRKMVLAKLALGEFWETSLRLAGFAAGRDDVANDYKSRSHWVDTSSQSFQSLTQGLALIAEKLEIAPEMLWGRIPNWDEADTKKALELRAEREAKAEMDAEREVQRQIEVTNATRPPAAQ